MTSHKFGILPRFVTLHRAWNIFPFWRKKNSFWCVQEKFPLPAMDFPGPGNKESKEIHRFYYHYLQCYRTGLFVLSVLFQEVTSLWSCRERKKVYSSTMSHVQLLKLPCTPTTSSIFHQLMQNAEPAIDKLVLFLWPLAFVIFMVLPRTNQDNCPETVDRFVKLKLLSQGRDMKLCI
jgi:hypothetical protein